MPKSNPKILIIGGGFGGAKTALRLAGHEDYDITLISSLSHLAYYPQFYHTATGGYDPLAAIPLSKIFGHTKVKVVQDTIATINPEKHTVTSADGNTSYHYDKLVLALGNITNYFGIKGLAEHSLGIKSTESVNQFRQRLHDQVLNYDPTQSFVVVGGGPTGVELAASLGQYLNHLTELHNLKSRKYKVVVVEAMPRLLPRNTEVVSARVKRRLESLGVQVLLNAAVKSQTPTELQFENSSIKTQTVVWTSGVAASPFYAANAAHFNLAKNGKVTVDDHLQASEDIYVIGDNALTPFSGMAQTALHDAKYVAGDLPRALAGQPRSIYRPFEPITVLPVGKNWAFAEWHKQHLFGLLAHWLRLAADFVGYYDMLPIMDAAKLWLKDSRTVSACSICASADKH